MPGRFAACYPLHLLLKIQVRPRLVLHGCLKKIVFSATFQKLMPCQNTEINDAGQCLVLYAGLPHHFRYVQLMCRKPGQCKQVIAQSVQVTNY